ncbi:probable leucine-rich repeat receptor-like serine/threonine-protein kinase At3g14840 isoform X2 [Cornus florida]|uniref:probable leucine-rich repeat receptor-like serine/threonine-protein kinase At3g14840 isoform X2 n=1 Tax=Cornus florida TaxID=4283 RepID=UPI0028A1E451|nr:probable leucine-rich repeat receptor-like serine/threonine-protein kinase At3g14840 isoform X2 [Cornus florida]
MSTAIIVLLLILLILICVGAEVRNGSLPAYEMNALGEIAEQLGKKDWNFSLNPCDGNSNWQTPRPSETPLIHNNTVNCSCSYPNGECHVISISLQGQDLAGVLPPSLAKLPYLKTIDLTRNYLSGTIPPEWASTKLEYLSVAVNCLSGPIPAYLGNIATLIYMSLEINRFSGMVPAELGKLPNLVNLILSGNNLTGELRMELTNLTKLTELRLSNNNFTGKLPSFQSWKQLQMLEIEAGGFEGPIPPDISVLNYLTELRISDLYGGNSVSVFPQLGNMKGMKYLVLRSCNISEEIPKYIAEMNELKYLDLSFNKLEGKIPNLEGLRSVKKMYLTSNLLSGPIPEWIKSRSSSYYIDLSYNNFSEDSIPNFCPANLNLFRSFSKGNNSELGKCFKQNYLLCSEDQYSFHINCGGAKITIGNTIYEADEDQGNSAKFVPKGVNWGTSISGDFWERELDKDYIAENVSVLRMKDSELYTRARLSPLSLTYYGRCLANGKYTVTLHFAEIIFRENQSFQSLGRRMFDIYIQDELVLKDFDIEHEAQGVDKVCIKKWKAIVKDKTIEIRFHWAGKGTTKVPFSGSYGTLVSAISVASDNPPDGKKKISIIVGAVASALCLILIVFGIVWWKGFFGNRTSREQDLRGLDLQTCLFTFRQIKAATNNFDVANKIGEGGFGSVYKGILLDGTVIAVKQLSSRSNQGNREFVNEIGMISGLQHPNLARLYGCCIERSQLLLVYEYMENNSLASALFGPVEGQLKLDWPSRQRICIGIAKGLAFLHEESTLKIVHRDIKATNVLLDRDLNPKISDFGLAKLHEENSHINTRIAGTIGYMAPEYALWGYLTDKADVYSFGVVALEIVVGKKNVKYHPNENYACLLDWAFVLQQKGSVMELVDQKLGSNYNKEEVSRMIQVALLCTNPSPEHRPTMSAVVSMLEGRIEVQNIIADPNIYGDDLKFKSLRDRYGELQLQSSSDTQTLFDLSEATRNGSSSTSAQDLH